MPRVLDADSLPLSVADSAPVCPKERGGSERSLARRAFRSDSEIGIIPISRHVLNSGVCLNCSGSGASEASMSMMKTCRQPAQQKENSLCSEGHLMVPCLKERPQRSQETSEGFISFAGPQRFYMGNDPPAIVHRNGGGKGRLPAIGNSVTDLFK